MFEKRFFKKNSQKYNFEILLRLIFSLNHLEYFFMPLIEKILLEFLLVKTVLHLNTSKLKIYKNKWEFPTKQFNAVI